MCSRWLSLRLGGQGLTRNWLAVFGWRAVFDVVSVLLSWRPRSSPSVASYNAQMQLHVRFAAAVQPKPRSCSKRIVVLSTNFLSNSGDGDLLGYFKPLLCRAAVTQHEAAVPHNPKHPTDLIRVERMIFPPTRWLLAALLSHVNQSLAEVRGPVRGWSFLASGSCKLPDPCPMFAAVGPHRRCRDGKYARL